MVVNGRRHTLERRWRLEGGASEWLDFPKIVVGRGRRGLDNVLVVSAAAGRDAGRLAVGPILVFRGNAADSWFALASRVLPANLNYQIAAPPVSHYPTTGRSSASPKSVTTACCFHQGESG